LYHVAYEGTITDEDGFAVLGGEAETISERFASTYEDGWSLERALRGAVSALAGPDRTLGAEDLEVALLSRANGRRAFRRIPARELGDLLGAGKRATRSTRSAGARGDSPSS
ncbi:MAG: proteasome subunit alpha, partial [Acidimicrobiales bacterium]